MAAPPPGDPMPIGEVRPGDVVLLVTDGSELDELVTGLDGSHYSHAGVMSDTDDGLVMLSAVTAVTRGDTGGVRPKTLDEVEGRRPHVLRPSVGPAEIGRALQFLEARREDGRHGDVSGYSYVKLFLVSVALRTYQIPDVEVASSLRDVVLQAAAAWTAEEGEAHPSYFCSELVAQAFDRSFTVDALDPGAPTGAPGSALPGALVEGVTAAWPGDDGADGPLTRAYTLGLVLDRVLRHDRAWFGGEMKGLAHFLGQKWNATHPPAPLAPLPDDVGPAPLPAVLVTPRMLACCDWLGAPHPVVFR